MLNWKSKPYEPLETNRIQSRDKIRITALDGMEILIDLTMSNLYLSSNNIGAEGTKLLAIALEKNKTLKLVDLSDNLVGDEGTKALAAALEKNTTLHQVYLNSNHIGAEGARALASALEKNTSLRKGYFQFFLNPWLFCTLLKSC